MIHNGNVNFYLLPFVKPSMVKQVVGVDENGNNLSYNETLHRLIRREEIDENDRNVLGHIMGYGRARGELVNGKLLGIVTINQN